MCQHLARFPYNTKHAPASRGNTQFFGGVALIMELLPVSQGPKVNIKRTNLEGLIS